ncbi:MULTISPECIES: 2Fe-2S iron-sulfur cluster-binding protein [Citricoccus]|uniref:2Fe-2S iron-sulfur cluster-binding protein n=1 Tax=Citricoccus TaxID=169133 RepID=UPI000255F6EB|nr:2Fe-2S iron-sulfur cluster-binding protein [Citricoccus sp. CH26A]
MNLSRSRTTLDRRIAPQPGEVIDRSTPVEFTWNGRAYSGFRGDTIVSALAAAGVRMYSRSMKYHRPRGLLSATLHDPGCMVQVDGDPNVRGAHRLIEEGMKVSSQNTWPSLEVDVRGVNQLAGRFLGPGFYYKTFIKPQRLWPVYETVLRQFVHGGRLSRTPGPEAYDKRHAHADVLVAGGGPAGLAAALAAAERGARVMLVEEGHQLGGHLRWSDPETAAGLVRRVAQAETIQVLTNATVAARYDDNWCAVVQRHPEPGVAERLLKTRARSLIVAPGLLERPYVFDGNDTPGVMLSTAARSLVNLYGVAPGERAVVFSANPDGDAAAEDLERAGVEVVRFVDARAGQDIVRVRGRKTVESVELADGTRLEADLLVTATGWTAPTSLLNMSGDVPVYEPRAARFLPGGQAGQGVFATGGIAGDGSTDLLIAHGHATGAAAAVHALGTRRQHALAVPATSGRVDATVPADASVPAIPDLAVEEHPELFRSSTHGMVDFSEDVSSKDLYSAVAEGYDSAELAKRFTTVTMGPTQGKHELMNAIAVIADATGKTIAQTGTTTWRPMYAPVTLGALAGPSQDPVRYSEIHSWHEANGAVPLVAGQWIRPEHYGDPEQEVRAVREAVGIIDVSPIGKLDLRGPDVPKLLETVYTNKWSKLEVGRVRYGAMCREDGVVFDDGVTARLGEDHYLMSTTSSGAASVWEWLETWLQTERPEWRVHVTPVTTAYTSINVAGPQARRLVSRLVEGIDLSAEAFGYMRVRTGRVAGVDDCILWRIGFTGELSYELHVPASYGLHVWEALLEAGQDLGVTPFGVEAQRVLRLEKGHLIIGQDTDGLTQAYSAGLDWAIKLDKPDFAGKPELAWQREHGGGTRLVALQPVDPDIVPAEASQVLRPDGRIGGRITSSRHSPTLGRSVCLGQLEPSLAAAGSVVDVRLPDGRTVQAAVMDRLAHLDPDGTRLENDSVPDEPQAHPTPLARGPLSVTGPTEELRGWQVAGQHRPAELSLTDYTPLVKVGVRAEPTGAVATTLQAPFGRVHRGENTLVIGSGPGEWLVLAEPCSGTRVLADLGRLADDAEEQVSVVDLTHGRAMFRLTGREVTDLLASVCALDLSDDLVPDGSTLRTTVAGVVTDLVRLDEGGRPSYLLHCERSSGIYLSETLLDTGRDRGLTDAGAPAAGYVIS